MMRYATHSWDEVSKRFRELAGVPGLDPLATAVPRIAASQYAAGLYPVKSMHSLLLYQHDRAGSEDDQLVLTYEAGEFVVRYRPGHLPDRPAARRMPEIVWTKRGTDALALLQRAFHHLRWFSEYHPPAV